MKVEIVTEKGTEEIDLKGNKIFPYYISVASIGHYPDKIVFRLLGKYKTKYVTDYDTENEKSDDRLWIMGIDKTPELEGGEPEKIM